MSYIKRDLGGVRVEKRLRKSELHCQSNSYPLSPVQEQISICPESVCIELVVNNHVQKDIHSSWPRTRRAGDRAERIRVRLSAYFCA